MEFGIEKLVMLIMKSGKKQMTEGIELLNQEKIRTLGEKETYKSSSSRRAACADIPDRLSPFLPIIHRLRQVFRITTRVLT